jgi:hypothetical protein
VSHDDVMAHRMVHASLKKLSDPPSQNRCRPSISGLSRPDAKRHEIDIPRRFDRVPDRHIRVGGRGADLYGAFSRLDEDSVLRWHLPCQCDAVISLTPGPGTAILGHAIWEPHCWRVPDHACPADMPLVRQRELFEIGMHLDQSVERHPNR